MMLYKPKKGYFFNALYCLGQLLTFGIAGLKAAGSFDVHQYFKDAPAETREAEEKSYIKRKLKDIVNPQVLNAVLLDEKKAERACKPFDFIKECIIQDEIFIRSAASSNLKLNAFSAAKQIPVGNIIKSRINFIPQPEHEPNYQIPYNQSQYKSEPGPPEPNYQYQSNDPEESPNFRGPYQNPSLYQSPGPYQNYDLYQNPGPYHNPYRIPNPDMIQNPEYEQQENYFDQSYPC